MSKAAKVWLIVGAALVLAGCVVFCCVLSFLDWDFNNLSTENYETKVYEFDGALGTIDGDIYIETDTADVEIVASRDMDINTAKVVCYENIKEPHSVSISDGVLTVKYTDARQLTDFIGVNNDSPKVTIYLPQGTWGRYGDLYVKTSTGDVAIPSGLTFDSIDVTSSTGDVDNSASVMGSLEIENNTGDINMKNMMAFSIELSTSTGDISLENVDCHNELNIRVSTGKTKLKTVSCGTFISKGTTGDIIMDELKALLQMTIERTSGDVEFRSCDSSSIRVFTDTGDVYGVFSNNVMFNVETDTGDVDVPEGIMDGPGGYIQTNTGDVKIEIED
ncbi:MAG: DUF4097 family beta strand repeat protein [Oscillospiraceae bacterium]|nr:DUF4097 family beta strand repeat protein [Oscillospiraceae bacterium]